MLATAIVVYCAVYWIAQATLPGNFEITSTVNNTMPLVLAGVGQGFVVVARALDLSVGGRHGPVQRAGRRPHPRQRSPAWSAGAS